MQGTVLTYRSNLSFAQAHYEMWTRGAGEPTVNLPSMNDSLQLLHLLSHSYLMSLSSWLKKLVQLV